MRSRRGPALLALAACSLGGCISAPSPLVPGLAGSVGAPHSGVQTDGVELPQQGPGYVRFRARSPNHFGRPRLVRAITQIAARLAHEDPLAPPLVVGDLSAKDGGKIPGHQSHRSGRDVDLLFYFLTPRGQQVTAPGFIHVDTDGLALVPDTGEILRFDVDHEWRLVKALVNSPDIGVQFLFVSRTIEALLVDYALARGEPLELVLRAASVMLEPGDSTPHDDHVHVRIACTAEEAQSGCLGGGPHWEWLAPLPVAEQLDLPALTLLATEDPLEPDIESGGSPIEPSAAAAGTLAE